MSTSKQPTRFGYKMAVIFALGFAGFAAWPYLSNATERLSEGKPVTMDAVKRDVEKEDRDKGREREKRGGYGRAFEPKSVLALNDGSLLVGGKPGLQEWRDGQLKRVEAFEGEEARGLAVTSDGSVWAASKDGLWKRTGTEWKQVRDGDFWGISVNAEGVLFLVGKTGVLRSRDGEQWESLPGAEMSSKPGGYDRERDKNEPGKEAKEAQR